MMYLPFIFSIKTFEATFALILSTLAQIFTQTFILPLSVYCVYVWDIYIYIYESWKQIWIGIWLWQGKEQIGNVYQSIIWWSFNKCYTDKCFLFLFYPIVCVWRQSSTPSTDSLSFLNAIFRHMARRLHSSMKDCYNPVLSWASTAKFIYNQSLILSIFTHKYSIH